MVLIVQADWAIVEGKVLKSDCRVGPGPPKGRKRRYRSHLGFLRCGDGEVCEEVRHKEQVPLDTPRQRERAT